MKRLLLSLMTMCSLASQAQSTMEWALTEQDSGETVLMSSVSFLLASDSEDTFAVVCNDGRVIAGARSVSFCQIDPSGIKPVAGTDVPALSGVCVEGRLRLTGCVEGTVITIYDGSGRTVRSATADGGNTVLDVSGLPTGVYILRASGASVKFMKK